MKVDWKKLIRPCLALLLVVIGCAAVARFLSTGETLAEYAENNPEAAYGISADASAPEDTQTAETVQTTGTAQQAEAASTTEATPSTEAALTTEAAEAAGTTQATETAKTTETAQTAGAAKTNGSKQTAGAAKTNGSKQTAGAAKTTGASQTADQTGNESQTDTSSSDQTEEPSADATTEEEPSGTPLSVFVDDSDVLADRVTYDEGFFYEPIPAAVYRRMLNVSYPEDCPIPLDSLRYLNIRYVDFENDEQNGELVCNELIAEDLTEIFKDLYDARYQLERVQLVDDYGADDDTSMLANNTSCFNYRTVAGTTKLSNHARGLAIDINPLYNPWVNHGTVTLEEAAPYADRDLDFPHKITVDDYCCQCFLNHGFFWGGNWNNPDYQHFQRN